MRVSLVTVLYSTDSIERETRAIADVLAALPPDGELIVVDNSPDRHYELAEMADTRVRYDWGQGYNELYGGGINRAVRQATGEAVVYFSCKRGKLHDASFIDDLTAPLADPLCGMTGNVRECRFDRIARTDADIIEPQIHVQGGLWAARRETLRAHPYSPYFWQVFSDVWISWKLLRAGLTLVNVPTVSAVAIGAVPRPERYKYVVDY